MKISILEWGKSIARVSAKRRIPNGGMNSTPLRFLSSEERKKEKSQVSWIFGGIPSERDKRRKLPVRKKERKKERKRERSLLHL